MKTSRINQNGEMTITYEPVFECGCSDRSMNSVIVRDDAVSGGSISLLDEKGHNVIAIGFDQEGMPTLVVRDLESKEDYLRIGIDRKAGTIVLFGKRGIPISSIKLTQAK